MNLEDKMQETAIKYYGTGRVIDVEDAIKIAEQYAEEMAKENKILRKLLWLRHGCELVTLYGDDGEMQCGTCSIDFKRMSVENIRDRWAAINKLPLATEE